MNWLKKLLSRASARDEQAGGSGYETPWGSGSPDIHKALTEALQPHEEELAATELLLERGKTFVRVSDPTMPGRQASLFWRPSGYIRDWRVSGPRLKRDAAYEEAATAVPRFLEQLRALSTSAAHGTPGRSEPADR